MEAEQAKLAAPYVPFTTFIGALDHLKAIGIPHVVDRRVFPNFNGVAQGQVLGAFKFLGLIDDMDKPAPALTDLVEAKDRKPVLRDILKNRYPALIALELGKVSPSQFDKALGNYGVQGDTHRKAKSFFLKAAQYVDLSLSPLLTRKTRTIGGTANRRKRGGESRDNGVKDPNSTPSGTTKAITLKSGGQLTLALTVNIFDLVGEDRDFVFGIIDKIQAYQSGGKSTN